jgi:hypothetical protein
MPWFARMRRSVFGDEAVPRTGIAGSSRIATTQSGFARAPVVGLSAFAVQAAAEITATAKTTKKKQR